MYITILCLSIFAAMVFQYFADYLTHRLTAKTRHGTHSPFVYKLTDEVIYDFSAKKPYEHIEQQRKKLLNDDRLVTVNDVTKPVNFIKNQTITTRKLAKHWLKTPKIDQLIYRLILNHNPKKLLEFGTGLGITTAYLANAVPKTSITTIDCFPALTNIAQNCFATLNITNVKTLTGNPEHLLAQASNDTILDVICFNEKLDDENLLHYFNLCLNAIDEKSMIIINGIYRNEKRKAAWTAIKNHPKVTVTIDLFWMGLVYFKTDQAEEDFRIRF